MNDLYEDLRVIDLSQGIAGPYAGLLLRQGGADVIKVEPANGDWARAMGIAREGFTALALAFNAGKRSVAVDAQSADGRAVLTRLVRDADVVIQSFRPGVAERLGIGYETVKAVNPRIVYASVSGFGGSGPYVDRPGTDSVLQAMSGLMVANRDEQGAPRRVNLYVADVSCGLYTAHAIAGALFRRERRGVGRHVEVSLLATMAAVQNSAIIDERVRDGAAQVAASYPNGTFRTLDSHVMVFALNDTMFAGLCRALGKPEWLDDPAKKTNADRLKIGPALNDEVAQVLATRTTAAWMALLREHDVLHAEINDYPRFVADPQVQHMGFFGRLQQPGLGELPFAALPGTTGVAAGHPVPASPRIGEHTREVLAQYGYGTDEVEGLLSRRVVFD